MKDRIQTNARVVVITLQRNGNFPNSHLPVLLYRQGLSLPKQRNRAAEIIQQVFARNSWTNSWRNGIYDFHHYHSNTHECMAVAMGRASVILGGPHGKRVRIEAGDVLILPAGTAHKRTVASDDFYCVGAYPNGMDYDMNRGTKAEMEEALPRVAGLAVPEKDPVFGEKGFLEKFWK